MTTEPELHYCSLCGELATRQWVQDEAPICDRHIIAQLTGGVIDGRAVDRDDFEDIPAQNHIMTWTEIDRWKNREWKTSSAGADASAMSTTRTRGSASSATFPSAAAFGPSLPVSSRICGRFHEGRA